MDMSATPCAPPPLPAPPHCIINVASYCAGGGDNVNVNAPAGAVAKRGVAHGWPQALTHLHNRIPHSHSQRATIVIFIIIVVDDAAHARRTWRRRRRRRHVSGPRCARCVSPEGISIIIGRHPSHPHRQRRQPSPSAISCHHWRRESPRIPDNRLLFKVLLSGQSPQSKHFQIKNTIIQIARLRNVCI